ncbi:MAG TPA: hypothetical protein VFM18_07780 [Methanosarcina sp.]|nr:hypothetical protein [Methanosarcina sp.]
MTRLNDSFGMSGTLKIFITPKGSSESFLFFSGTNRITNNAREHILRLTVENPSTVATNPITSFKVGNGGVGQTPNGTETDLFASIDPTGNYLNTVSYALIDGNLVAEYSFELTADEANGFNISEVGLFASNPWMGDSLKGMMFNIKTFPELVKTAAFSVTFVWRINYSGVAV